MNEMYTRYILGKVTSCRTYTLEKSSRNNTWFKNFRSSIRTRVLPARRYSILLVPVGVMDELVVQVTGPLTVELLTAMWALDRSPRLDANIDHGTITGLGRGRNFGHDAQRGDGNTQERWKGTPKTSCLVLR